jgi:SpoVK/Ycf46/Vps4 family AAA+-type ATPase
VLNRQFIRAPKWSEIRTNYPESVRADLERLIKIEEPWKHGRLIIMHGAPGTGKTYAIRSLLMEWRDRFNFVVITDPEMFTGTPSYYYGVASEVADMPERAVSHSNEEEKSGKGKKHHLFVLEDTADLLLESNRATHGDKIGKLLNMTDGLFGQGREDVFLLTFNESAEKIDKAFLRPGRCLLNTNFPSFDGKEASTWLSKRGVETFQSQSLTLAEMYAKVNGVVVGREESAKMGFGR